MGNNHSYHAYLDLATKLFRKEIISRDLSKLVAQLPVFTKFILQELIIYSEQSGLYEPGYSRAIMQIASKAAHFCDCEPLVLSQVDWYLGYAYNCCVQPQKSRAVILRARRVFVRLNQAGWVAACDWQLNAFPWTTPNFVQTIQTLEHALGALEQAGFEKLILQCRLTLADAQLLVGDYKNAQKNLGASEILFGIRKDPIHRAQCWVSEASMYRRLARFDDALGRLQKALKVFKKHGALLEIAKTHCQMGLCYFLSARNYQKAEQYFEQACTVFSENGIELFYALCLTYWGQVSIISGNLQTAASQLHKARAIFTKYELLGLTAENYNDSGQLELLRGNPTGGIDHFKKAEAIYRQSGVLLSAAIALANQGDAFAMIGQFQNALHHLELAESEFQALNNPSRLAGCEMYLSKIMTDLNQYTIAHEYLDKAEELFIQVKQDALLAQVYAQRAKIFSLQTRYNEVISSLNRALEIAKQYNAEPQVALAERQLGEVLSITGHSNDAFKIISGAEKKFGEMGLVMEQAASLIALGYHSVREMVTSSDAENAFKQALGICRGVTPELESQAFIGLAMLAEKQGHLEVALENYREALRAIANSRSGFWQPSLAGSYLQRSVRINDEAIGLAVILKAHTDAFMFIESNKAQSLVKQMKFSNPYQLSGLPVNIENLRLEIQALQQQLRVTYDSGPMVQLSKLKNIQRRLIECAREYDRKLEQIERKTVTGSKEDMMPLQFNVNSFVNFANKAYGKSWVALDYYLTDHILFGSVITPDGHHTWATNISMKERIAINACTETYLNMQPPSLRQLNLLGNLLIPPGLENYLSTDTLLIIVPHRDLHQIPWAALQADSFGKSLVEISIPVVVPSLQVLQIIWERANQNVKPDRKTGLLVGVANFKEFRQPLPQVHHEIEALSQKANPESITLVDASANKNALTELLDDASPRWSGLSRFSFFHIASHIIYDSRTGRLTSIALYNDEIWLDQLRDFAPLPKLVTLSACNGTQSLVFTGDEQVGLATTCLIAGTDAVVGSLWPILDSTTADLMIDFYDAYFTGCSPAKALAQAQRNALQNNKKLENWASFIFIGTP